LLAAEYFLETVRSIKSMWDLSFSIPT
jgi:hypothetical protein